MQREEIVKRYFQAWLDQNIEPLGSIFPRTLLQRVLRTRISWLIPNLEMVCGLE